MRKFLPLVAAVLALSIGGCDCGGTNVEEDAGVPVPDAGSFDAGTDSGIDAGTDSGVDAGEDAGVEDAGQDAGEDAGQDAGEDAGFDAGEDAGQDAGEEDAGSDAGADAGTDGGAIDAGLASFEADLYEAICANLVTCGIVYSAQSCAEMIPTRIRDLQTHFAAEAAAIRDGRAAFDPDAGAQCLASLANSTECNFQVFGVSRDEQACRDTFVGLVTDGGGCYAQEECPEGQYCGSSTSTCPGNCLLQADAGQIAPALIDCTTALFAGWCNDLGCLPGLYNFEGVCEQPVSSGAACVEDGGFALRRCVSGAFCDDGTGQCEAKLDAGQPCDPPGEMCKSGFCTPSNTCGQLGELDGGCSLFANQICQLGLACSNPFGGTCVPASGDGGTCFFTFDCQPGLFCNGSNCAPVGGVGASCADVSECSAGLYCDWNAGTCQTQKSVGSACDFSDYECAPGLSCEFNGTTSVCTQLYCVDPTP